MLTEWPTRGRQIAADGSAVPELRSSSSATSSANQRAFNGTKWFGLIKRAPARRRTTGRGKGIAGRSDRKSARCRLKNMFSSGKEAAPRCDLAENRPDSGCFFLHVPLDPNFQRPSSSFIPILRRRPASKEITRRFVPLCPLDKLSTASGKFLYILFYARGWEGIVSENIK